MNKLSDIKEIEEQIELLSTIAIPRERDAYQFYVELANNSSSKNSKDLFIDLARQEIGHQNVLTRLKEELILKLEELKRGG